MNRFAHATEARSLSGAWSFVCAATRAVRPIGQLLADGGSPGPGEDVSTT